MAIWQFQCNIIPLTNNNKGLSHEEKISWSNVKHPSKNIDFLDREDSWSKNIVQYGKDDETCIEFIYDEDTLKEIYCRFDLRYLTKQNFIDIIKYVKDNDAVFLVGNAVYDPELSLIQDVMKNSEAYKYCKDPVGYISSMDKTAL